MRKKFYGWWVVAGAFLTIGLSVGLPYYNIPFFYDYFAKTHGWRAVDITRGFFYATLLTLWVGPVIVPSCSTKLQPAAPRTHAATNIESAKPQATQAGGSGTR